MGAKITFDYAVLVPKLSAMVGTHVPASPIADQIRANLGRWHVGWKIDGGTDAVVTSVEHKQFLKNGKIEQQLCIKFELVLHGVRPQYNAPALTKWTDAYQLRNNAGNKKRFNELLSLICFADKLDDLFN